LHCNGVCSTASGTKERSAFFHRALTPLCKLPPDTPSGSSGRRPSIAISDRSSGSTSPDS
jgi:hypothetical protein